MEEQERKVQVEWSQERIKGKEVEKYFKGRGTEKWEL